MNDRRYAVYILSNTHRTVLYTGITNDVIRRLQEHRDGTANGFTKRYHVHDLVYVETYENVNDAIAREKQIKSWSRKRKDELVTTINPELRNLTDELGWL